MLHTECMEDTDKEKQKRGSGRRRRRQLKEDCARTYKRIVIFFR